MSRAPITNDQSLKIRVGHVASTLTDVITAVSALVKLAIVMATISVIWFNRDVIMPFVGSFLGSATHLEIGVKGLSIDRQASAVRTIDKIAQERSAQNNGKNSGLDREYALGAIARASRNAPAVRGARILWVDGHPENNRLEESIFRDMGIEVRRALDTTAALRLLPGYTPDLIISNVVRPDDQKVSLTKCPVHYFEVPSGLSSSLAQVNTAANAGTGPTAGFAMAEIFAAEFPEYVDPFQPRVIYYSSSSGTILAAQCSRIVTNRVDILLQEVVSALEELRWQNLIDPDTR